MSKVFRAVAKIAGVVASVAAVIPGGQPIAAIAGAVSAAASIGAQLTAKKPRARGSTSNVLIGANQSTPYAMGRTYVGGNLIWDVGYGGTVKKVPNPYSASTYTYSWCGPIDGFESFQADFTTIPLSGNAATGYYAGFLYIARQLGARPEASALAAQWAGEPGWGAAYKLSGHAAAKWSMLFDKDGKIFASGAPQPGAILRGVKVYDPRLDSTYPGGSGSQRLNDESTWAYSESPALHAGTYAYGRTMNGKKVFGVQMGATSIDWACIVAWANVCTANGWKVGGTIYEPGDKWNNLKLIAQAGGAEPMFVGGVLSFKMFAPVTSLATVTADSLAEGDIGLPGMQDWEARKNGLVPQFRSEAHQWEYVDGDLVTVAAYVTADGEEKNDTRKLELVQDKDQAAELVAYELYNGRELGPWILTLKLEFNDYDPGEALTLNIPEIGLSSQLAVITGRKSNPDAGSVTFEFMSETAAKHALALGQAGTAPPAPSLVTPATRDDVARGTTADPNATADVSLTSIGTTGVTIVGNRILRQDASTDYNATVCGDPIAGPCFAAIKIYEGNAFVIGSVDNDNTTTNYTGQEFNANYRYSDGSFGVYRNGAAITMAAAPAASVKGEMVVGHDGVYYRIFVGGVEYLPVDRSQLAVSVARHYPKWAAYAPDVTYTGLRAGVFSDNDFASTGGATKPENNATTSDNRVFNGDASQGLSNWKFIQFIGSASALTLSSTANAIGGAASFRFDKASTAHGCNMVGKAIPVIPGETMFFRMSYYGNAPASSGLYARVLQKGQGADPGYVDDFNFDAGYTDFISNGPVPTTITDTGDIAYKVPSGVYWVSPAIYAYVGGPTVMVVDDISLSRSQKGADVTSTAKVAIEISTDKEVAADYTGAVSGTDLGNVMWSPKVTKGGVSIKTDNGTSYALSGNSGGTFAVDNTGGSADKGLTTISAMTANTATVDLTVTVNGVAEPKITLKLTKKIADPPPASGGSNKTISYTSGDFAGLTVTTPYTSILTSSTWKSVVLASGEKLYGDGTLDVYVLGNTFATRTASLKWQYSVAGANSWNDFGTAIASSSAASANNTGPPDYEHEDPSPGSLRLQQTKTGLPAGTYDIRIVGVCSATGRTLTFTGTATCEAKP